jgi:hypothetical protein
MPDWQQRASVPDCLSMAISLIDDATDACVRCGGTDKTSIMEIRPHQVWCCMDCYRAVLAGFAYYDPEVPQPMAV